jgi:small subunit ribosomal protein S4
MAKCAIEQGTPAPGQHGARRGRKMSEYGEQLRQKQRLRRQFGMQELQFKRFFKEALRRKGVTGEILLQLLETRLDNLVYRLGFASSRRAARQYVLHGHVAVNGHTVSVPSAILSVGDVLEVRDRPRSRDLATRSLEAATTQQTPVWLSLDKKAFRAELVSLPTREQIAPIVDEQSIVELYSR